MASYQYLSKIVVATDDDTTFWKDRFIEHVTFLYSMLNEREVPELKYEALELSSFLKSGSKIDPIHISLLYAFLETINNEIDDVVDINNALSRDDFRDLVRHMIIEQTYYVRLISGKITVKDELLFWLQETAEHMSLISNLLPHGPLRTQTSQAADILKRTRSHAIKNPLYLMVEADLIKSANRSAYLVNDAILSGKVQIDDEMLIHEIKESTRGEERVHSLLNP